MTEHPYVTAIVLNYNGAHLLPDCLSSLLSQDWPALEVLVVDNGSVDDSASVAAQYNVRWLPLGQNLGFSRANNMAAKKAKGDCLFIVNNDMKFPPDCVSRLMHVLGEDPSLFAVDPTQFSWDGSRIIHGRTRLVPGHYLGTVIPPFAVEYTATASGSVEVPWGCAGSLLVRRDRFEALGGFDPTFFIDFEDADLCWRAWRRGWRTVYVPDAWLYHKAGMSGDEYHHLVQSVSPGKIPKFWFRRRVSYHTNLLRFAIKCLPLATVARLVVHLVARIAWHVTRRNLKLALAMLLGFVYNVVRLPDTWVARRAILRTQVFDHHALIRRFASAREEFPS